MDQPKSTVFFTFGGLTFEWHAVKAELNVRKHGVTFEEAAEVFVDEFALILDDPEHSEEERRLLEFALSPDGRFFAVSHVERGDHIRIISARYGTSRERRFYDGKRRVGVRDAGRI